MDDIQGLKVLIVEDEAVIAMLLESMLEEIGCEVVASAARLAKALDLARSAEVDLALLDINLAGEPVFPLAFVLADRGVPFVFSTGYGNATLPAGLLDRPVINKPFTIDNLKRAVAAAMGGPAAKA